MQSMIASLSLIGIGAALCEQLLPEGRGEGTKRALRLLLSLVVILVVSRPVVAFLRTDASLDLGAVFNTETADTGVYEEIFEDTVNAQSAADFKAGLAMLLEQEYGIPHASCEIFVYYDAAGMPTQIKIYLSGAALLQDPHALSCALTSRLGCNTEVR